MACAHDVRQVREDGDAVYCGACGVALEPTAEDLRQLAEAPPVPADVPYAVGKLNAAKGGRG